ncbi:MAG: hypothetical protein AB1744_09020 [Candidatus Zixiibacteriota bacterium]
MTSLRRSEAAVFMLLVLSMPTLGVAGDDQKWQLEIELSKQTYLAREPIWLDAVATNISSDTVRTWGMFPLCDGPFHIEVRDSLGKALPYTGPVFDLYWGDGFLMGPNEQYYGCYDLVYLFASSRIHFWFGLIPPGKYSVRAGYRGAVSQEISFEIVEPTGQEVEVCQMMVKAFESGAKTSLFREVVERYPKSSVYAETAFHRLYRGGEFLKRFPNSGYTDISLRSATRELSREAKHEYLSGMINEYPETRAAKFAKRMLMMLEKEADKDTTEQGMRE